MAIFEPSRQTLPRVQSSLRAFTVTAKDEMTIEKKVQAAETKVAAAETKVTAAEAKVTAAETKVTAAKEEVTAAKNEGDADGISSAKLKTAQQSLTIATEDLGVVTRATADLKAHFDGCAISTTPLALLGDPGSQYPFCVREVTGQLLWEAVDKHLSANDIDKSQHPVPLACGPPGIGKSRLAMEVLSLLQNCASNSVHADLLKSALHVTVTFHGHTPPTLLDFSSCPEFSVASRVLWSMFARETHFAPFQRDLSAHLSFDGVLSYVQQRLGKQPLCVVLAVEFNLFPREKLRDLLAFLCSAFHNPPSNVVVVLLLAGTDWREANDIIRAAQGLPFPLPLPLLDAASVDTVCNHAFQGSQWRLSAPFRALTLDSGGLPCSISFLLDLVQTELRRFSWDDLDWDVLRRRLYQRVQVDFSFLSVTESLRILFVWLNQEPVDPADNLVESGTFTWASAFQKGIVLLNREIVSVPWIHVHKLALRAGIPTNFLMNDDPVRNCQQLERFVSSFLVFRRNVLLRDCNSPNHTLAHLLRGATMSPSARVNCDGLNLLPSDDLARCVSVKQFPSTIVRDAHGRLIPWQQGTVCFTNEHGAPADVVWPQCCLDASGSPVTLYAAVRNWEADTEGRPDDLACDEFTKAYLKAKQAHDAHPDLGLGTFFFVLVTSRGSSFTPHQDDCAAVGLGAFNDFFGPLSARAHFGAALNLNTCSSSVLQGIKQIGTQRALDICEARRERAFLSVEDAQERCPCLRSVGNCTV